MHFSIFQTFPSLLNTFSTVPSWRDTTSSIDYENASVASKPRVTIQNLKQHGLQKPEKKIEAWEATNSMEKGNPSSQKEFSDDRCRKCGQLGHSTRGCETKGKAQGNKVENATVKDVQYLFSGSDRPTQENTWLMDSGASSRMVNTFYMLEEPKELKPLVRVILSNNDTVLATHVGFVFFTTTIWPKEVLYVEFFRYNLLSTTAACRTKEVEAKLSEHVYNITKNGKTVVSVKRSHGMFRFKGPHEKDAAKSRRPCPALKFIIVVVVKLATRQSTRWLKTILWLLQSRSKT